MLAACKLTMQIAHKATRLMYWHKGFEVELFTGGSSKGLQLRDFKRGRNDIVVATFGQIRDVLENDKDIAQVLKTASHVRTHVGQPARPPHNPAACVN
jgi:ATP-dependent RNA helicase MSS116, mitochondrial